MNEYTFEQLVDVEQVRTLLESHQHLSGMAYGILDTAENSVVSTGWQEICTRFHRAHPVCSERCLESNAYIKSRLHEVGDGFLEYRCSNGMIDVAMPIIIEGRHLATFFIGHFFYDDDPPDREFFLSQAHEFGFDREEYLAALERAPLFSREYIRANLTFLHSMVQILAESGLKSLRLAKEMEQRKLFEERYAVSGFALDQVREAAFLIDETGRFHYVNQEACRSMGYSREELLGMTVPDIDPDYSDEMVIKSIERLFDAGSQTFETRHRTRDGRIFPVEITSTLLEHDGVRYNLSLARDISERKRAEESLRASRDYLENIINAIADPVFVKDELHRFILVNDAECALAGCSREELLGKTDYDFFPRDQVDLFWRIDDRVLASGEQNVNEELITDAAGETRTIVTHKSRYIDPLGNRFVVGVIRDITARKQMEEQLRQALERYALSAFALDQVREAAFLIDDDGRFHYVNQEACRSLGFSSEELSGMTVYDINPDFSDTALIRNLGHLLEQGSHTFETRHRARDGRIYPVEITITLFEHDGARFRLALARDISERKRIEEALVASERSFRALAENLPDVIVRYDRACRRIYVNPAFERVNRLAAHQVLGKTPLELSTELAPLTAPFSRRLAKVMETAVSVEFELSREENGKSSCWYVRIIPESDSDGNVISALTIWIDITERKRMEQQLRQALDFSEGVINAIPDLLFEVDRNGRYLNVWTQKPELLAGQKEILLGKTVHDVLSPEGAAIAMEGIREAEEQGLSFGKILPIDLPHGRHWFELSVSRKPDSDPTHVRFLVLSRDITERRELESALQKSSHMLEEAQRIARMGSWELNLAKNTILWSEEIYRILAIKSQQLDSSYEAFLNVVHPDDREVVNRLYNESVEKRLPCDIEHRLLLPDGSIVHVHERCETYYDDDGTPLRTVGTIQDITERKLAEQKLLLMNFALDHVREAAFLIDERAHFHYVNEEACRALDYSRDELLIRGVADIDPDWPAMSWPDHWHELKARGALVFERRHKTREGYAYPVEIYANYFEFGGQGYNLALARDITERKRSEEALDAKRVQLAALAAELSLAEERERQNIAAVLHDHIGQMLLLGRIKLGTLAGEPMPEPHKKMVGETKELLDQVTHDIHTLTVQMNPPILAAVGLEAALEWLGRRMEEDYGLFVEFEDDLLNKPLLDEVRSVVYQCGRELLINVAKHTDTGHARLVVGREDDRYRLTVEDDGAGFDPAVLVPDASRDCRFGLLSIQIRMERMGGSVVFESTPGQGSRMTLLAPLALNESRRKHA